MPIPVKRLEDAKRPLADRIGEFLRSRSEEAFTILEIFLAVEGYDQTDATFIRLLLKKWEQERLLVAYEKALHELMANGQVREAHVQSQMYFAAVKK